MVPHLSAAYNLARWILRNPHDAEDAAQEAFLRAYRFFDGFRGGDAKAWLLAIVRNTCTTWRERERPSSKVEFDEKAHANAAAPSPESQLSLAADRAGVHRCIEALPAQYREIVILRELEEMSYRQIAETAGVPIGTVMSRLARARKRLEECLTLSAKGAGA